MDPDKALARIVELAERLVNGTPEDMEWGSHVTSAEELAETFLGLDGWLRRGGFQPKPWRKDREEALAKACRGLLQDIGEVLEREGEEWWDDTVTSGTHHRHEAEKLVGEET